MVALNAPNVAFNVTPDSAVLRIVPVEVRKANSGDTVDVASQLTRVGAAMFIGTTVVLRAPATVAGTVITNDSGYLIVLGL